MLDDSKSFVTWFLDNSYAVMMIVLFFLGLCTPNKKTKIARYEKNDDDIVFPMLIFWNRDNDK